MKGLDFVQVSRAYLKEWRGLTKKSPLASEILMYFIEHMGKTTNAVVCSYATLVEITGMSRATVARAVKILRDDNWIEGIKIGGANAYAINARAFWQASNNQRKYAIFQATVIAARSEQDSDYDKRARQKIRHIPFVGAEARSTRVITSNEALPPPDQQDLDLN